MFTRIASALAVTQVSSVSSYSKVNTSVITSFWNWNRLQNMTTCMIFQPEIHRLFSLRRWCSTPVLPALLERPLSQDYKILLKRERKKKKKERKHGRDSGPFVTPHFRCWSSQSKSARSVTLNSQTIPSLLMGHSTVQSLCGQCSTTNSNFSVPSLSRLLWKPL